MSPSSVSPIVIFGIDPGSHKTGYGVIRVLRSQRLYVGSGIITTDNKAPMPERLKVIFKGLQQLISQYHPNQFSVEKVFLARNPDSALKLGQARGAAICATAISDQPVYEYSAREIKLAVVGTGSASKMQVAHMVKALLGLSGDIREDAADALAAALCHANSLQSAQRMTTARSF